MTSSHSKPHINKHDISFIIDDATAHPPSLHHSSRRPPSTPGSLVGATHGRYRPSSSTSTQPGGSRLDGAGHLAGTTTTTATSLSRSALSATSPTTRAKPFPCKLCDKTFAERGNANKHFRVAHLKQRNHHCPTCGSSFAFRDGLNRHISMVHLNERPFECRECMCPGGPHPPSVPCTLMCGMRFKQKSHRRRHVHSVHHAGRRGDLSPPR